MITRRDALRGLGLMAGAAAAPGLVGGCEAPGSGPAVMEKPKGITTIVTLCMENRTYDHYLGARALLESKPGDGLKADMAVPDMAGQLVKIRRADVACVADPPHGWDASRRQFNEGKNDGFMIAYQASQGANIAPHVMGYMTRDDLPVTWALSDAGTSFDRWFSSLMGPTWPNRLYLHAAQSGGYQKNTLPQGLFFEFPTIYSRLNAAKVPWKYYFTDLPFLSLFKDVDPSRQSIKRITEFFDDAAAGRLPPVVFIDPGFTLNDDHPPHHPMLGQQLIASLYAALANSPQWENVLFVVTYDEHGGFFDHVPPPKAPDERAAEGFDQLGFRVPTFAAGPYVKPGHVSSVIHDHTSVLRHIGRMFDLPPLTMRDAAANDLTGALDMARLAANQPAPPVKLPEVMVDESKLDAACKGVGAKNEPTDLELLADSGYFPPEEDLRREGRDTLHFIGEVLEKFGAGGIRRGR